MPLSDQQVAEFGRGLTGSLSVVSGHVASARIQLESETPDVAAALRELDEIARMYVRPLGATASRVSRRDAGEVAGSRPSATHPAEPEGSALLMPDVVSLSMVAPLLTLSPAGLPECRGETDTLHGRRRRPGDLTRFRGGAGPPRVHLSTRWFQAPCAGSH